MPKLNYLAWCLTVKSQKIIKNSKLTPSLTVPSNKPTQSDLNFRKLRKLLKGHSKIRKCISHCFSCVKWRARTFQQNYLANKLENKLIGRSFWFLILLAIWKSVASRAQRRILMVFGLEKRSWMNDRTPTVENLIKLKSEKDFLSRDTKKIMIGRTESHLQGKFIFNFPRCSFSIFRKMATWRSIQNFCFFIFFVVVLFLTVASERTVGSER